MNLRKFFYVALLLIIIVIMFAAPIVYLALRMRHEIN